MQAWECDFGLVSYWDNERQNYDVRTLKLSYNADDEGFPVKMRMESATGQLLFTSSARNLVVETDGDLLRVTINGEQFMMDFEQKAKLLSCRGKWDYTNGEKREVSLYDAVPSAFAKDFGLVYVDLDGTYTMANLKVDFDWNSTMPILLFICTYDKTMMPQTLKKARYEALTYDINDIQNGLAYCSVCDVPTILTKEQLDYMDSILALLA